jgi:hypothetical protein
MPCSSQSGDRSPHRARSKNTIIGLTLGVILCGSISTRAQDIAPAPNLEVGTSEWMATAGPGLGVPIFHSAAGHRYLLPSLSWGRLLTRPRGPGILRGQFEWSVELVPIFGQLKPEKTYGLGFSPLVWRWNFTPRGRVVQFAELAGGALWTRDPVPARTTTANFTAHVSYGVRYFLTPKAAFVFAYRLHHISNGNRLKQNPGVNAHVLQLGFSLLR